jgi:hypothetical protein
MAFKKAEPKQAFLKLGLYGPQGSGKTFTALLVAEGLAAKAGKRVAYIDTERGTDFYAQAISKRGIHPDAFDFDALYTRSLSDVLAAVKGLDLKTHGVVVVDSISHLWDAAIAAYEGKQTSIGTIPMNAWSKIKKPYKELLARLLDLPVHVLILGRQKNVFENDAKGDMVKVGVAMRAEGETEYEPHICCRFESKRKADGTLEGVLMIVEKDRSGVLHGRTIPNPSFATFEPLLPYLGAQQAVSEDPDEVAARDSELLSDSESKAKDKAAKSNEHYVAMNARITGAQTLDELSSVASEIKKLKRYLTGEHEQALRLVYTSRHETLSAVQAPKEIP